MASASCLPRERTWATSRPAAIHPARRTNARRASPCLKFPAESPEKAHYRRRRAEARSGPARSLCRPFPLGHGIRRSAPGRALRSAAGRPAAGKVAEAWSAQRERGETLTKRIQSPRAGTMLPCRLPCRCQHGARSCRAASLGRRKKSRRVTGPKPARNAQLRPVNFWLLSLFMVAKSPATRYPSLDREGSRLFWSLFFLSPSLRG